MNKTCCKITLFGIDIDNVDMQEAIQKIELLIKKKKASLVVTPNVHHINILKKDSEFRKVYKNASLVIPDSTPLTWFSKIVGMPLKERVAGSDLLPLLSSVAAENNFSFFFLGAGPGIARRAAEILIEKNPGLEIVGTYSPYFGFENNKEENGKIVEMIKKCKPDVLFVCLGPPKQEKWSWKHKDRINVPVIICAGAALDFVAGKVQRAPIWMQKMGLEWFHRYCQEPKRLWKRYFVGNAIFSWLAMKEFIKLRLIKR